MRTIFYILQKEFLQIRRNKMMLPFILVVPIVQLIILVHAATLEMKNIRLAVVNMDQGSNSRRIISKFEGSPFFNIVANPKSVSDAEDFIKSDKADVVIVFQHGFENDLVRNDKSKIQVLINSINGTVAGISNAYINSIVMQVNKEIITEFLGFPSNQKLMPTIEVVSNFWYNPQLNYKNYMVPGILVLLVTIVGLFLSGLNLVREKEIGTIEQINVTPIRKYQFITGKLLPFWIIALFELGFGLVVGKLLFNIPIVGNLFLLYCVASVYLFVILGFGLFISTITNTQQQSMFISWFFLMIFILMSGLFTSIESMPDWAQWLNKLNPVAYFIRATRMILLKGSGLADIKKELIILSMYGFCSLSMAIWRYKKTT